MRQLTGSKTDYVLGSRNPSVTTPTAEMRQEAVICSLLRDELTELWRWDDVAPESIFKQFDDLEVLGPEPVMEWMGELCAWECYRHIWDLTFE